MNNSLSWLSWFLRGILLVAFLILTAKIIEVQIIKGSYYRQLSEENRIRHIMLPAPRGQILARGGEVLAGNVETKKRIVYTTNGGYELTDDLTNANLEEIVSDYRRFYPLAAKFGHASGYVGAPNDSELLKVDPNCPAKGIIPSYALVGKSGLEKEYECFLRGTPGEEIIEVNIHGIKIRTLGRKNPIAGQDLKTTIDYNLQQEVADDMNGLPAQAGKKGAAIATDSTGGVLAFYSEPSYDPNLFISRRDNSAISALLSDKDLPFFNRVTGGTFHPGSVFKPLVAIAALQENSIDKNFLYNDVGIINVGTFSYTNWYFTEYGRTEGQVNLTKAIARSTDTFFYKIGEMVGPNGIAKWADLFGADKITGIDLPGEAFGLIPTPEWKKKTVNENWFLGNTYHMAIGQGDVSVTPAEVNTYISAISNNGLMCPPHFLNPSQNFQFSIFNFQCKQIQVKKENLDLIKEGMKEACSTGGTGYTFFDFSVKHGEQTVACKTGTAEVGTDGTPHAWFTVFSPIVSPEINLTILVERGGQGSVVAGPIARKIMDFYFQASATSQ